MPYDFEAFFLDHSIAVLITVAIAISVTVAFIKYRVHTPESMAEAGKIRWKKLMDIFLTCAIAVSILTMIAFSLSDNVIVGIVLIAIDTSAYTAVIYFWLNYRDLEFEERNESIYDTDKTDFGKVYWRENEDDTISSKR